MQVDAVVRGDEAAARLCSKLSRRLDDGSLLFGSIVDRILESERERFHGRGQRWAKLSRETIRTDAREGRDPRTLIVTGRLMRSLTERGAPGQILRISPTTLTFGTNVFYAKFHQYGLGVPKRTLVGLTRPQHRQIVSELRRLLLEDL